MSAVSPTCILFMWDRKEFVAGSPSTAESRVR
jgi:hypothetical protein